MAVSVSGSAVFATNTLTNTVEAGVKNGSEVDADIVSLTATDSSGIDSTLAAISVSIAGSGGASLGLALALSLLFTKTFPEFGADAGALTLGVVALSELIAPVILRAALVRSGEAGQRVHFTPMAEPLASDESGLVVELEAGV